MATSIVITHYTVTEALELLGINRATFYRHKFDRIKVLNKTYIPKIQVDRVLQGLPIKETNV